MISKRLTLTQSNFVTTVLNKVAINYKQLGFAQFIKKCILCVIEVEPLVVDVYSLNNTPMPYKHKTELIIKRIELKEFEKIAKESSQEYLKKLKISVPVVRDRFKMGHIYIGAFSKEKLCGYVWFAMNHVSRDKKVVYSLKPSNLGYMFDGFVNPDFRRLGIASSLYIYATNIMKSLGLKKSLSVIARSNKANRIARRKVGFQEVGWIIIIALLRKYKFSMTVGVRRNIPKTIESLRGVKF